jgi:four helix bundle protein
MTDDRRGRAPSFEDLEVFRRAYRVSLEVHRASLEFPRLEQYALADQLRRASKSICANVAEGYARQKRLKAEFRRFLQMALGSSDEMRVWLRYGLDLGYIGEPDWQRWRDEYQEISRMLQGLHRKAEG